MNASLSIYEARFQVLPDQLRSVSYTHLIWLIMNAATRSIIGYQVSDNRGVGPCILAMRMAFQGLTKMPENFKFIADGYSAYTLAAMEFVKKFGKDFSCKIDVYKRQGLPH